MQARERLPDMEENMKEVGRIPLEGLYNTRDLGGMKSKEGRRIRPRRLLRSGQLNGMTERDKEVLLKEYQLRTVVDFRTRREKEEAPDPDLPGVQFVWDPILSDLAVGITQDKKTQEDMMRFLARQLSSGVDAAKEYMTGLYRNMIKEADSRAGYRRFFAVLINQEKGAVLWHCSAGKDRVGVGTALLLEALDIPEEKIFQDYMLVNELTAQAVEEQMKKLGTRIEDPGLLACIRSLLQVQSGYLQGVLDEIRDSYGSMERFLEQEMDLGSANRKRLKELYLED